jgi:hypothetical protein
MVDSNALSSLQLAVLSGLGAVDGVFLSGGSCLALAYLGHRRSFDLDFFVVDQVDVEATAARLRALCGANGWRLEPLRTWPGFRRFLVVNDAEETLVDIVHDTAPQLVAVADKPIAFGARIDDLSDLVANKLCAALGRSEVKDLVDLYALDAAGVDLISAIGQAARKDAGMDPATLGWVLRSTPVDPSRLLLLRPVTADVLRQFRDDLVGRLIAASWPRNDGER